MSLTLKESLLCYKLSVDDGNDNIAKIMTEIMTLMMVVVGIKIYNINVKINMKMKIVSDFEIYL